MRRKWQIMPLTLIAIAGTLSMGLLFGGALASAGEARGLGRGQATFGSTLDSSGASGFQPSQRLGGFRRGAGPTQLGNTREQPAYPRAGEIFGSAPRGLKFDDNRRFDTGSDEGMVSRGRDHRGAPANKRAPFFPDRLGGR